MSAVVCGKRSSSIFADDLLLQQASSSPPSSHHSSPAAKRSRYAHHHHRRDGRDALLNHLRAAFPAMDPQLLERALEASGDDLDDAIKSLKELHLMESNQANLSATGSAFENGPTAVQPSVEDGQQPGNSGPEWVDLFVREMSNASDMDDARARASRALEALTKSILEGAGAEAAQSLHQENMMLKEQMTAVLSQNAVLKRAVAIQHERQKEFDERSHEVQGLKQLVLQYQEQLRTLEINNYALQMHLKQAQQSSSMPGRYNPDVF
ncbi:hypothetical protein CFC21_111602 [Triticum aestivum]|uniref:CUE domain-containing protein n=2 Tax=Triticum aestivum TaxID=4565 RepID=A0A3B6TYK0_WHEAT|nr:hypothetical protein CFC21_111602 [Triticum aestivum]